MIPNRFVPTSSVIPVLAYADVAEASDWLCHAFGFTQRLRIGGHRAQLVFGDGAVIVTDLGGTEDDRRDTSATHSKSIADVDPASWGATSIDIG